MCLDSTPNLTKKIGIVRIVTRPRKRCLTFTLSNIATLSVCLLYTLQRVSHFPSLRHHRALRSFRLTPLPRRPQHFPFLPRPHCCILPSSRLRGMFPCQRRSQRRYCLPLSLPLCLYHSLLLVSIRCLRRASARVPKTCGK